MKLIIQCFCWKKQIKSIYYVIWFVKNVKKAKGVTKICR